MVDQTSYDQSTQLVHTTKKHISSVCEMTNSDCILWVYERLHQMITFWSLYRTSSTQYSNNTAIVYVCCDINIIGDANKVKYKSETDIL